MLWNWSLYFILLFFILDMLSAEIVQYLKVKKVKSQPKEAEDAIAAPTVTYAIISMLFLAVSIAIIHLAVVLYHPTINLQNEIWNFLTYVELGIPQGIILIPLVVFMAYSQYRIDFEMPKRYLIEQEKPLWKSHLKERFVITAFASMMMLFATAYNMKEWLILSIILVVMTLYSYLQGIERIKQISGQ